MYWFLLFIAAWIGFGALSTVGSVGKERRPISGSTAAVVVLLSAVQIAALIIAALRIHHG
jgi:hypothetical protein